MSGEPEIQGIACSQCGRVVERASLRLDASYMSDMLMGSGPVHQAIVCDRCRKRHRLYGFIALGLFVVAIGVVALIIF